MSDRKEIPSEMIQLRTCSFANSMPIFIEAKKNFAFIQSSLSG